MLQGKVTSNLPFYRVTLFQCPQCQLVQMLHGQCLRHVEYVLYVRFCTSNSLHNIVVSTSDCRSSGCGSNPIRQMYFSALTGSYPALRVLLAQWEGWDHTAELHPLFRYVFEGVALYNWQTLRVLQVPGLVNTRINMTVSTVCVQSRSLNPK